MGEKKPKLPGGAEAEQRPPAQEQRGHWPSLSSWGSTPSTQPLLRGPQDPMPFVRRSGTTPFSR